MCRQAGVRVGWVMGISGRAQVRGRKIEGMMTLGLREA